VSSRAHRLIERSDRIGVGFDHRLLVGDGAGFAGPSCGFAPRLFLCGGGVSGALILVGGAQGGTLPALLLLLQLAGGVLLALDAGQFASPPQDFLLLGLLLGFALLPRVGVMHRVRDAFGLAFADQLFLQDSLPLGPHVAVAPEGFHLGVVLALLLGLNLSLPPILLPCRLCFTLPALVVVLVQCCADAIALFAFAFLGHRVMKIPAACQRVWSVIVVIFNRLVVAVVFD
jgi:hypothetical protein